MSPKHDTPEFVRRKFTLPERMEEILVSLAERHYEGNVSMFLRAAIIDHRDSLEGSASGERTLNEITRKLGAMSSHQTETSDQLNTIIEQLDALNPSSDTSHRQSIDVLSGSAQDVLDTCLDDPTGARFADLVEQTTYSPREIQAAIHSLLNLGYLEQSSEGRFRARGAQTNGIDP